MYTVSDKRPPFFYLFLNNSVVSTQYPISTLRRIAIIHRPDEIANKKLHVHIINKSKREISLTLCTAEIV